MEGRGPTLRQIKKAMRSLGHTAPYLGELTKAEVTAWQREHLTEEELAGVWNEAYRLYFEETRDG